MTKRFGTGYADVDALMRFFSRGRGLCAYCLHCPLYLNSYAEEDDVGSEMGSSWGTEF